jgi:hypothetical protein
MVRWAGDQLRADWLVCALIVNQLGRGRITCRFFRIADSAKQNTPHGRCSLVIQTNV